jgi:hypothetical protein
MNLQFFASISDVHSYMQNELVATLRDDLADMEGDGRRHSSDEERAEMTAKIADIEAVTADDVAGDVANFLAELVDCYSRNGEFNNYTAPLGTVEIREKAMNLAKRLGVQFPDDEDDEEEEENQNG